MIISMRSFKFLLSSAGFALLGIVLSFFLSVSLKIDNINALLLSILSLSISLSAYNASSLKISDPIFIFSSFLTIYTVTPLLQNFIGINLFALNSIYEFSNNDVAIHGLRFLLFNGFVCFFYFLVVDFFCEHRIKRLHDDFSVSTSFLKDDRNSLIVAFSILAISFLFLILLAAPVETYYDNYTKYDHLPSHLRTLVSVAKRLYWGVLPIIVVLILINLKDKKFKAIIFLSVICFIDLMVSKGSRINTLIIVVQSVVLYNLLVSPIKLGKLFVIALPFIFLMFLIEIIRLSSGDVNFEELVLVPGEFNALFFPSIELFKMRELGHLPPYSDLMIFKDIYHLIPFLNNSAADPMHWYWVNFHPKAQVAPFTMGPIADSAFYGSWGAIVLRAILLSLNLFILRALLLYTKRTFLTLLVFSYSVSISILVLKYSIFSYQEQLIKNLLPTFIVFAFVCFVLRHSISAVLYKKVN